MTELVTFYVFQKEFMINFTQCIFCNICVRIGLFYISLFTQQRETVPKNEGGGTAKKDEFVKSLIHALDHLNVLYYKLLCYINVINPFIQIKKMKKYCVAMSRYIMFDLTKIKFECEKILKKAII